MSGDEFGLSDAEEYFDEEHSSTSVISNRIPRQKDASLLQSLHEEDEERPNAAAHSCLALPELLERIILYVPQLEIYRLQRVNTTFRDLISRSIPIRRYMYFVPERYFIRPELRESLEPKTWQRLCQTKLSKALYPFRFKLYARKEECGVDIELWPGWMAQKLCETGDPFDKDQQPPEASQSWRRILIWDSAGPMFAVIKTPSARFGNLQSSTRLTGQVTLGDLVAEAKKLTTKALRTRRILSAMEGSACMVQYYD